MAEEIKPKENPEVPAGTPEKDAWLGGMRKKYPDIDPNDEEALYKASREGYDAEHETNKKNAFANKRIYDAIQKSPEVAGFIDGITAEGAEPEEAFAMFGEDLVDLLTGKIDNETYRNKKAESKKASEEKAAQEDAAKVAAGEAYVDACKELSLDPDETYGKLKEKYGNGGDEITASKDFYVGLIRSLSYDDDIAAAEARGRGTSVEAKNKRKAESNDGVLRGQAPAAPVEKQDPNSFAAYMQKKAQMNR